MYLRSVLLLHVLNGTPALDTANSKTRCVGEAADDPCLPLERALHGLVELIRVVEVDDVDVAISSADDQQLILDIHGVDALLGIDCDDRRHIAGADIPILDGLVPRTSDKHVGVGNVRRPNATNRLVMLRDHSGLGASLEIKPLGSLISASTNDAGSVL